MKHQALLTIQANLEFFCFTFRSRLGSLSSRSVSPVVILLPTALNSFLRVTFSLFCSFPIKATCTPVEVRNLARSCITELRREGAQLVLKPDLSTKHPRWSRRTEKLPIFLRSLAVKPKHLFLLEIRNGILLCFTKFVDVKLLSSVNLCILFWCNLCIYFNVSYVSI